MSIIFIKKTSIIIKECKLREILTDGTQLLSFIFPLLMPSSDGILYNLTKNKLSHSLENIAIIVIIVSIRKGLMNLYINTIIHSPLFLFFALHRALAVHRPQKHFPLKRARKLFPCNVRLVSSRSHHLMELIDMEWRMEE